MAAGQMLVMLAVLLMRVTGAVRRARGALDPLRRASGVLAVGRVGCARWLDWPALKAVACGEGWRRVWTVLAASARTRRASMTGMGLGVAAIGTPGCNRCRWSCSLPHGLWLFVGMCRLPGSE